MNRRQCLFTTLAAIGLLASGDIALAAKEGKEGKPGKKKHEHHDGKALLGEKVKKDGRHEIDKHGDYIAAVDVRNGKIAGMHVKHPKKGEVPVTKYKTNKDMASSAGSVRKASFSGLMPAQYSLGTQYIGYSYIDDDGYEQIYWYPYEMILDGDTGAIDYVPVV